MAANPRLPVPGADDGIWGDLLNQFLAVEHNIDGSLKIRGEGAYIMPQGGIPSSDMSAGVRASLSNAANTMHLSGDETVSGNKTYNSPPVVPTPSAGNHAANKSYVDSAVSSVSSSASVSDASATTKGVLKLTGDLGGTADSPSVPGLADKASLSQGATFTKRIVVNEPGAGAFSISLPDTSASSGITFGADTNIFRSGSSQLQTSSAFFAVRATLGVVAIGVTTSGDATRRFQINTDGKMLWSAGSGTQETTMVRNTTGGLKIVNSAGTSGSPATPSLTLAPTGITSTSTSGGGTFLINNGTNSGSAMIVYSQAGAGSGRIVNIRSDNVAFDGPAFHIDYIGTATAAEILYTGTGQPGNALNVTSTNSNDTAVGINGQESGRGTVKIVHNYPGVDDSNASALSLRANGTGTKAQGIFFDAENGGTTGNLMKFRQNGVDQFIMSPNGGLYTGSNIQVGSTVQDFGAGSVVIGLKNATTVPTTNPTAGIIIYSEGGVLKYRDPSGSIFALTGGGGSSFNPQPTEQGFKAWNYDPTIAANLSSLTSGQPVLIKVKAAASGTVSNIELCVSGSTLGSGFTANSSFAALYDLSGNLLAQTNDLATTLNSTGAKSIPLTSTVTVSAGTFYYVWLVINATTQPQLTRGANIGAINEGTGPGTYRFCTLGSSITSPPATITLSSSSALSISYWAALS